MRRKPVFNQDPLKNTSSDDKKGTNLPWLAVIMNNIRMNWKRIFIVIILLSVGIYLLWFSRVSKTKPKLPASMDNIYNEFGEGDAKPRRRPDLTKVDEEAESHEKIFKDSAKDTYLEELQETKPQEESVSKHENTIHIAIVACGDRAPEAITSLKSFAIFTKVTLQYHVFAEEALHQEFSSALNKWPGVISGHIKFTLYPIQFPEGQDFEEWKKLFKPCASQRLFLPNILIKVDSVLYVDTDVLILRPAEDIWSHFKLFNKTQLAALTAEHEVEAIGWYNRFAQHPYYGKTGLNSGVMLMNLTRMRQFSWDKVYQLKDEYRSKIVWGDQDILNILFHFYPELLYVYSCDWNYRPDHCMYSNNCEEAIHQGVSIVHGNRRVFHNDKQPEFKVIYEAVRDYSFGDDLKTQLVDKIRQWLQKFEKTYCGQTGSVFWKVLEQAAPS